MQKPGCQVVILIVSAAFAISFMVGSMQCNRMAQQIQEDQASGAKIATIGDFTVFEQPVRDAAEGQFNPVTATSTDVVRAFASALDQDVTEGLLLALAKQDGISLDDDSILKAMSEQLDESVGMQKQIMIMQKQLPPNATDQQFEEKFKAQTGQSLAQAKKTKLDDLKKQLQDPKQRSTLLGQMANSIVVQGLKDKLNITDQELQHSQDNYVFKRIFLAASKHPGKDVNQLAQQIDSDIKSKKITFEQAMDKYTDDTPGKGRAAHENTNEVQMNTMQTDPEHMPLRSLKLGEVSDPLPATGLANGVGKGVAIWRLESILPGNIQDFQKQKPTLLTNYSETLAAAQLQAGLKQERSSGIIKWLSPGWQLLEDWYQNTTSSGDFSNSTPAEQKAVEEDYFKKAKALNFADTGALMAETGSLQFLWNAANADEKKKLSDDYYAVLSQFNQQNATYSTCIDLAKMALEKKDGGALATTLAQAASLNEAGISMPEGQKNFEDLNALLLKVEDDKILKPEQIKDIQTTLNTWRTDRQDYDKQMAQQAKEAAEERAKADAERKKEAAAAAAASKKTPAPVVVKPKPGKASAVPPPAGTVIPPAGTQIVTPGATPQPATGGK